MSDNYEVLQSDTIEPVGQTIPAIVMASLAMDYLYYRYKLLKERVVLRRNTDTGEIWIETKFAVANRKDQVEINIWVDPVVHIVKREPSKEHPQGYKIAGVKMRTTKLSAGDLSRTIIEENDFPLRFEIADLPSVLSHDSFNIYATSAGAQ